MENGKTLLLECLKNEQESEKIARLHGYSRADWDAAYQVAVRNRLVPLLYHSLKNNLESLPLPSVIREDLRLTYVETAARNMNLYRQLLEMINIFNQEEIPVILLKGSHLAEMVYGNLALRPMSDMDLLVRSEDLHKADLIMSRQGYQAPKGKEGYSFEHLPPYRKPGAITIEIHFQITEPPYSRRYNIDDLWQRACREEIEGIRVLTLSPEDLLLHVSYHTSIHHGFKSGLLTCLDVKYIIDFYGDQFDWNTCWKRAETWGIERALYLILVLTEKTTGMIIHPAIKEKMSHESGSEAALSIAEEIIFEKKPQAPPFIARLFGDEPLRAKFRYIIRRLFPEREFMFSPGQRNIRVKQGKVQALNAYRNRIQRLIKRHTGSVWLALRRNPKALQAMKEENRKNQLRDWMGRVGGL